MVALTVVMTGDLYSDHQDVDFIDEAATIKSELPGVRLSDRRHMGVR